MSNNLAPLLFIRKRQERTRIHNCGTIRLNVFQFLYDRSLTFPAAIFLYRLAKHGSEK